MVCIDTADPHDFQGEEIVQLTHRSYTAQGYRVDKILWWLNAQRVFFRKDSVM